MEEQLINNLSELGIVLGILAVTFFLAFLINRFFKRFRVNDIGISYDSDSDQAKEIIRSEVEAHPLLIDNRTPEQRQQGKPKVDVRLVMLRESSANLGAWAWTKDNADAFALGCDVLESTKKSFDREGIEIPFPHVLLSRKNLFNGI